MAEGGKESIALKNEEDEDLSSQVQGLHIKDDKEDEVEVARPLKSPTVEAIVEYFASNQPKNIITMAGAGLSTSAGIPDFRTPGTGLYDNLQKFDLPDPQAIFSIDFFKENPKPFFLLAKELFPSSFNPTPSHYFIKLLENKGLLLRHYTQNIDMLETLAGVSEDKLVEAHGTFRTSHCTNPACRQAFSLAWMKREIFADKIPNCNKCGGVVKPDIVFFGEELPERFKLCIAEDMKKCDFLIVLGTSLAVQPFASLVDMVPDKTPRLLINLEKQEGGNPLMRLFGFGSGFNFDTKDNYRDVFLQGKCDDGCAQLADILGWKTAFEKICKTKK